MPIKFPNGPLEGAALTILACTHLGQTVNTTRYKVRYSCCGRGGAAAAPRDSAAATPGGDAVPGLLSARR